MSYRFGLVPLVVAMYSLLLLGQDSQLQIANRNLPDGERGKIYSEAFNATGGVPPYRWIASRGTPPPGVTLDGNGNFVGTPAGTGMFNFTVTVTDREDHIATGSFSLRVGPASGYDGPAQLPTETVATLVADTPAPGFDISVESGGDLQAALDNAQCGDTIRLQAGATFAGTFRLPALNCDDNHWIIVRTSAPDKALPTEGHRLTPCYAGVASLPGRPQYSCSKPKNVLAKLVATSTMGPLILRTGANHYRLMGLELVRMSGPNSAVNLISVEHGGTANHIVLDRSWLHGTTLDETRSGFHLSGTSYVGIVDSYFSDFHCIAVTGACIEAHAVSGGTGDYQGGPYKIENNFLEASGQAILFGGGPATTTPSDIVIRFNHFFKPWQWMKGNSAFQGGASGYPFIVRHALELKNASRVLIENNLIENVWGGFGESGTAILLTPKNQHVLSGDNVCPTCEVTDVTVRYTSIVHASGGFEITTAISGNGVDGAPAKAGAGFSIHDVVMDDISRTYVGSGRLFLVANSWPSNPLNMVTIAHITGFPDLRDGVLALGNHLPNPRMYGFVFTNNIVTTGRYPVLSTGGGRTNCAYSDAPLTSLNDCFSSYTFTNNALIAAPSHYALSAWPLDNLFASDLQSVGFMVSGVRGWESYQLRSGSPFKNRGTDGKDLGADIVGLNYALQGVE